MKNLKQLLMKKKSTQKWKNTLKDTKNCVYNLIDKEKKLRIRNKYKTNKLENIKDKAQNENWWWKIMYIPEDIMSIIRNCGVSTPEIQNSELE